MTPFLANYPGPASPTARNAKSPNEPKTTLVCNKTAQTAPTAPCPRPRKPGVPNEPTKFLSLQLTTRKRTHYRTHYEPTPPIPIGSLHCAPNRCPVILISEYKLLWSAI